MTSKEFVIRLNQELERFYYSHTSQSERRATSLDFIQYITDMMSQVSDNNLYGEKILSSENERSIQQDPRGNASSDTIQMERPTSFRIEDSREYIFTSSPSSGHAIPPPPTRSRRGSVRTPAEPNPVDQNDISFDRNEMPEIRRFYSEAVPSSYFSQGTIITSAPTGIINSANIPSNNQENQ